MAEKKIKHSKEVKHIYLCTCDKSSGHEYDKNDTGCVLWECKNDLEIYEVNYFLRKKE
jgi:hypothetical protein